MPATLESLSPMTHPLGLTDPARATSPPASAACGLTLSVPCHGKAQIGGSPDALSRAHSPIGLDIGAETLEELATSIVAELIQVRAGKTA